MWRRRQLVFFQVVLILISVLAETNGNQNDDVTSEQQANYFKKHCVGCDKDQDPNDAVYKDLARDSLRQYMNENGLTQSYELLQVTEVKTQVVAGIITKIGFNAQLGPSDIIKCYSTILEQDWLNVKDIKVTCDVKKRQRRRVPGGDSSENPNDPKYKALAEESLVKYKANCGLTQDHQVLQIKKVTGQVVAGLITKIDFNAIVDSSNIIPCHSEIWEQPWLNKKDISVNCGDKVC